MENSFIIASLTPGKFVDSFRDNITETACQRISVSDPTHP